MIFVQIAAYRDPELLPTIVDCIAKAKYPNDLRFGICWQRGPADCSLTPLKTSSNFRIDEVPWDKSQGLCWARARIQALYEGEEYTLQLDSHHRFTDEWDDELIRASESTGSSKPILSSYAGSYTSSNNRKETDEPYKIVAEHFTNDGTIACRPQVIEGWKDLATPIRSRFISGHFLFTIGKHCTEYRYDPYLYFDGDEISLSIRSFTLGYDLFHPHRSLIWHEYGRIGKSKHWDDHNLANAGIVAQPWYERDAISKRRLRKLLREEQNNEDISGYDLGEVRTHRDYEVYAGINFAERRLDPETILGYPPPCNRLVSASTSKPRELTLKWNNRDIERCEDCEFTYFGLEDEFGNLIYRYDAPPDGAVAHSSSQEFTIEICSPATPVKLVVWPRSRSRGWLKRIEYDLTRSSVDATRPS